MFLPGNLIGQQRDIELFNNIGILDNLEGRLTVWLAVNPTPKLHWEFEAARGEYNLNSISLDSPPKQLTSWDGSNPKLTIEEPTFTFRGGHRRQSRGYAEQVVYGDINANAHYFECYLPNTDFLRKATGGNLEKITTALKSESFQAELGNGWSVELFTTQEALDWLQPKSQNRGSMITLKLRLSQTKQADSKIQDLLTISLMDAYKMLSELCLMLSFINGGYVKPIYVIGKKFTKNESNKINIENVAAIAEAPLIVPQEDIGEGFIRDFGINDLLDFFQCFRTFQKMLQTAHWHEKWIVLLEWYFQAIPWEFGRRRNVLAPVRANALGTLLENLARIILVYDEPDPIQRKVLEGNFNNRKSAKSKGYNGLGDYRIETLLQRIGIFSKRMYVQQFIRIRNNATHAEIKPTNLTDIQELEAVQKAVQWVDEVILWRLGYIRNYRDRSFKSTQGIQRYDLSLRDSHW